MLLWWTPGIWELVIILIIVLLFAGKNRLPELARSIGSGITEFRKGISGQGSEEDSQKEETGKKSKSKKS